MGRREELESFIAEILEHKANNPNETPAVLIAVMVDPDTGRVWICERAFVSDAIVADVLGAMTCGERVDADDLPEFEDETVADEA